MCPGKKVTYFIRKYLEIILNKYPSSKYMATKNWFISSLKYGSETAKIVGGCRIKPCNFWKLFCYYSTFGSILTHFLSEHHNQRKNYDFKHVKWGGVDFFHPKTFCNMTHPNWNVAFMSCSLFGLEKISLLIWQKWLIDIQINRSIGRHFSDTISENGVIFNIKIYWANIVFNTLCTISTR